VVGYRHMATTKKTPTTKKPAAKKKAAPRAKVELKVEGSQVIKTATDALDTASGHVQDFAAKPQVKKAVKQIRKNVKKVQKNKDVKRVVKQVKTTANKTAQDVSARPQVQEVREKINVRSGQLVGKIKEIIKEGNVRRIIIQDKKGKSIAEFPLTAGLVGAVAVPLLVVVGTIAAMLTECTITVVREK